jgi:hypothetical protein
MGIVAVLTVAGCGVSGDKQKEEVTKSPTEEVTKAPEDEATPTSAVEVTTPVQGEEVSYELSVTFREETEEAKDGDIVYFLSGIYYPVFEGNYADNMNRFVTSLVEDFREILPDAKESAQFDYEESKMNEFGMQIFPEAEELTVSCVWSKEQITVLKAEYYSNTGGAHPNVSYKAYVVDMRDGREVTFERMSEEYGVTTDMIIDYAVERLREEYGEDLFETDHTDVLNDRVSMFTRSNQWYLNENGLVLFANPYDIAPYAAGVIECEIPYKVLEEGLKK